MQIDPIKNNKWSICLAICFSIFVLFLTHLIPEWGRWYSDHLPHRWQMESLLHGHLGLTSSPAGMDWDLAWGDGMVQQVWGLGIPFWQLPLELAARIVHQPAFPDRIAFLLSMIGALYITIRFHFLFSFEIASTLSPSFSLLGIYLTILFPPFVALCSSRFLVYEQVMAYGFLFGMLLMIWTAWLWLRPTLKGFYGLALVSGLIMFVRPTFIVYGFVSFMLGCAAICKAGRRIGACLLGAILFSFGIGLLLWLNKLRFGYPLEFGYSLNLNELSAMVYAQRFGNPYDQTSLIQAAKELFGLLFLTRSVTFKSVYGTGLFPLQSNGFRWRELYFSTYDLSVFFMVIVVLSWVSWRLAGLCKRRLIVNNFGCLEIVAVWSAMAMVPLLAFYLKFAFVSSRYLLDFGPAFAGACWVFFGLLFRLAESSARSGARFKRLLLILLFGWFGYEVVSTKVTGGSPLTKDELLVQMGEDASSSIKPVSIPSAYTNGFEFDDSGIGLNGTGWNTATGHTKACVVVYVQNPDCLILDLTSTNESVISVAQCENIKAKMGLEPLHRKSIGYMPSGVRITFDGPTTKRYQTGIQQASIAMVSPGKLDNGESQFRLLRISWHEPGGISAQRAY